MNTSSTMKRQRWTTAMTSASSAHSRSSWCSLSISSSSFFTLRLLLLVTALATHLRGEFLLPAAAAAPDGQDGEEWIPCHEYKATSTLPNCLCSITSEETYHVNCDHVVFPTDIPNLPFRQPIVHFSQRFVNSQNIPPQAFVASGIPLHKLDLSHNWLRRLTEKSLDGLTESLEELDFSHNLLGDQLNPIFSTTEFKKLPRLKKLSLGHNLLSNIDNGILEGCLSMRELYLDNNDLRSVPTLSFKGPNALRLVDLSYNQIEDLKMDDFGTQPSLLIINLNHNKMHTIHGNSFKGMSNLKKLDLEWNRLHRLNSDPFNGLTSIEEINLANNYFTQIPVTAIKSLDSLKHLNLSANLIQNLEGSQLKFMKLLETLDLSRNRISEISRGFFVGMINLKELNLGVNQLRTLPASVFEGLTNLKVLNVMDNNLLTFPTAALDTLPTLNSLILNFNRISALTPMKLQNLTRLSLSHNLIRQIPGETFSNFPKLQHLNLHGNLIEDLDDVVLPPELLTLDLGLNNLQSIPRFQLIALEELNVEQNVIQGLVPHNFVLLSSLVKLNLKSNIISNYAENSFDGLASVQIIDLSSNAIEYLPKFGNLNNLRNLNFSKNLLKEIGSIENMNQLTKLDLSFNQIKNIKPDVFTNTTNLVEINLRHNKLNSFRGFNTHAKSSDPENNNGGSSFPKLKILNLSSNEISYVFPNSFENFESLWSLDLSGNRFTLFPTEFLRNCKNLRFIGLSNNKMKNLNEMNFSNFPHLIKVDLSQNSLEFLPQNAFLNSSQIQFLDLSGNKLENIEGNLFHGLSRLELDLSNNYLSTLPANIFDRNHVLKLQKIDLSRNTFHEIPADSLQKQYFYLETLNLAENQLIDIPPNLNILVNVKNLDLSNNKLNDLSVKNILNEPKTVRSLNLASCGIKSLPVIEMPFLRSLNLSGNPLSKFDEAVFQRTTLLQSLDLSAIGLMSLESNFPSNLVYLDLSRNLFTSISGGANVFPPLLEVLKLNDLEMLTKVEKTSLNVKNLRQLELYNIPKLGYLDIRGLLSNLKNLEDFDFEMKDHQIVDQIHPGLNARVNNIGLRGKRVRSISTGAFAGLTSPSVKISLINTSLTLLPSILVPVPMSSHIILNLNGSKITNLSPPFLSQNIRLEGLSPICDCNAVHLVKYLKAIESNVICSGPRQLEGVSVLELKLEELVCESGSSTSTTPIPIRFSTLTTTTTATSMQSIEDDIITGPPSTKKPSTIRKPSQNNNMDKILTHHPKSNHNDNHHNVDSTPNTNNLSPSSSGPKMKVADINNMDNLIIGIVGGVVGLIVLFVVSIVCFVKLSNSSFSESTNEFGMPAPSIISVPAYHPSSSSKCTCSHKSGPHSHHFHAQQGYSQVPAQFAHHPGGGGGILMPSPAINYATVRTGNGKVLQSLPPNLQPNNTGNGIYGAYPFNAISLSQANSANNNNSSNSNPGYNNSIGPISLRQQQQMMQQQYQVAAAQQHQQQMYASLPYYVHEDYERR